MNLTSRRAPFLVQIENTIIPPAISTKTASTATMSD